jgi:hypothetical protein
MKLEDRKKCPQLGCTKEIYLTAEDALDEIERILTTQKRINDVKPCRAYKCNCGFYALTSKPKITEY